MSVVEEVARETATVVSPQPDLTRAEQAFAAGDFARALAAYDAILAVKPGLVAALAGRGATLRALGRPRDALVPLLEALSVAPRNETAKLELALALRESGRRDEARTLYGLLLRDPAAPAGAWHGLALLLLAEGRDATAEICLRRAVAMAPERIDARQHLADLLARREDLAGAVDQYNDILAIAPGSAEAHAGLGQALTGLGRLAEAEDQFERALALDGDSALAHLGRARIALLSGDLAGAWEDFEWRWALAGRSRPEPPGDIWDGSADLAGQTILLWAEQGVGEIVHLLRYVPLVADTGARVVLGLPAALAPLAEGLPGVTQVLVSGAAVPPDLTIGLNASLSDLPRLLGADLADIPPTPYLSVPEGRRRALPAPAGALLKVGVVWAGPRPAWSVPLPQLMPLLAQPGMAFYSLQTGPRAREVAQLAHPALIADLSPTIGDYADLAARMAELDVVVTVDGPAAHLAGALGIPAWVLLPTAPDWRWMLEREDSPWYGSARLFRQSRADSWTGPVQHVCHALKDLAAQRRARRDDLARTQSGAAAQQRAFLAAHLRAGDVLVDVGSGGGAYALDAAAHPAGDVAVLAIEARPAEASVLTDTIAVSGADEAVEVITAALGAHPAPAVVSAAPRAGRTVFPLPDWVRAPDTVTTLDEVLAARPHLAERRLVLRLGVKGAEDEVLAGLSAEPAVMVFEHRAGGRAAECLTEAGYRLFRFPGAIGAGPVAPFAGEDGPVLALAPGEEPAAIYGDGSAPGSPAAIAHATALATRLAAEGAQALAAGRWNEAGTLLARALAADPDNVEANANLGGLLRRIGRADAAAACWRRAIACGAGPAVHANLANVLRELGRPLEAEDEFVRALGAEPDNARFLYAFGLLERERGRAREALALFDRAEHLAPGTIPRRDYASALLKSGNLARGMAEMAHRPAPSLPPVAAEIWDGARLDARTILVRDENDAIDTVMLARFIPQVARQGGLVVVECVPEAARLVAGLPGVEQVVPRGEALPPVDVTVNLLDVPRLLGTTSRSTPPRDVPYLHLPEDLPPHAFPKDRRLRVGIAWSGRPTDRSVPASVLLRLAADPRIALVSLQRGPRADDLTALGADVFVEDLGSTGIDLADSAAIIAGLDLVVATDTAEAHLAGALGKPVWVLVPTNADWRWVDEREDCVWYPTMRVFRQALDGTWGRAMARVAEAAGAMAAAKQARG